EKTKVATKTSNLTVLEFCCAIYTQNQSNLGLPEECCLAESALTYYINARINYHIRKEEEPHNAKLGLYKELLQYTTKKIAQYANENFLIFTRNTRKCVNKTKENSETNQESNQQKLETPAQTPKKTPKFGTGFENCEEKFESESEKETSKKTITRPSRNQETRDQKEKPDIKKATFRNTQGNIIPPSLRPISPPTENGNKMATSYIARLTDFSEEEKEMDMHTWLREAQKAIQTNNWNNQRAIQTLPFFLKGALPNLKMHSWSILQNTGETVTQYFAQFNQIHCQIEAIEQGYYTDLQVLNQFIREIKSSILGRVRSAHLNSLPEAITLTRALESAEKEANHSQIVNMVIEKNKTETLEKRIMQLGEELSKKIESYFIPDLRRNTYQPPQRHSQEVSDS
ncbi:hypothetical protein G9A89_001751, partial [Geosiphon pyriformis]